METLTYPPWPNKGVPPPHPGPRAPVERLVVMLVTCQNSAGSGSCRPRDFDLGWLPDSCFSLCRFVRVVGSIHRSESVLELCLQVRLIEPCNYEPRLLLYRSFLKVYILFSCDKCEEFSGFHASFFRR